MSDNYACDLRKRIAPASVAHGRNGTYYRYDNRGRLNSVHVTQLDGSSVEQTTSYTHDAVGA